MLELKEAHHLSYELAHIIHNALLVDNINWRTITQFSPRGIFSLEREMEGGKDVHRLDKRFKVKKGQLAFKKWIASSLAYFFCGEGKQQ